MTEGVYNVASGTETSLLELAEALLRVMGSDLPVEYGPERGVNGVARRLADIVAAARATSASRPRSASRRACASSSSGGAAARGDRRRSRPTGARS